MAHIPIGLQLYSVRDDCARDLPGTLAAVARMGYTGVEFYTFNDHKAQDVRTMLDDLGLVCCGAHVGLATLLGDALKRTVEYHQTLGNKYLVVPSLPEERRKSIAAWRETARLFSDLAARVKPHGMLVGYHNHGVEFQQLDGQVPFDVFFGATSPEVIMQLDLGNGMHGGGDMLACLRRYPGRAVTIHLKEYSPDNMALIGDGGVPWNDVFALCEQQGKTEWYIVEHEHYQIPPLACVQRCLENLRAMGK